MKSDSEAKTEMQNRLKSYAELLQEKNEQTKRIEELEQLLTEIAFRIGPNSTAYSPESYNKIKAALNL